MDINKVLFRNLVLVKQRYLGLWIELCIVAQSNEWIKFPSINPELMEAKRIWQSMYKFPTAIGVIDCTHIGILKPNRHGDEYINRKGKPTLNVLVMPERCSQVLMSVGLNQCMIPEYGEIHRLLVYH
ncbi:unnamed protein product [Acanthoscelides obtectus]|uniref:Nuclease HARBI1 n=1 Tax=Acanthoscelides obtectus TaxID=200917 RepID=A0A9P0NVG9_ACAOB|nr:unnamed protein product [Acanthoscelides obtectus]CAK1627871.1 Putative nuclease HARBI1 [Acanthoscelides obtectus]